MLTIPVTIFSMIYMILLTIVYFSKKRISTIENKVYSNMIRLSCFGIIVDALSSILVIFDMTDNLLFQIVTKFMFIYYVLWSGMLLSYTIIVSLKYKGESDKSLKIQKILKLVYTFFGICCLAVAFLPLSYHRENGIIYPEGTSVNLTYFVAGFLAIGIMIFLLVKNFKHFKSKKFIPIYSLLILFSITVIIQNKNPQLILTTSVECFITFLMYFTIENPDVQMMEELYRNKKLIEKSSEDTSNFLFRMTQDIKKPIQDIIDVSHDILEIDDIEEIKDGAKIVNNKAKELDFFVNDALDVSSMSTKTIKIFNTRYNPTTLFNEIKYIAENNINEKTKFEFNVARTLPLYLYGDSIKLKQAISSIIDNAIKNTSSGFISMNVDAIIKYDVCRLIITVSDSGIGMNIEEVNRILSLNIDDLSKIKLSDDKTMYNLKEIKKLTMIMGGNLIVKSQLDKGTTVSIIFDQKVVETNKFDISKKLELYEQSLNSNKKVMVVDDDAKELALITSKLEKMDAIVSGSLFGRDIIEKISNKQKFDLIILDDETSTYSGLEVLKELKKNPKFSTPVIIMINDGKEFIKLEYLKDGFSDVILKSKLSSELERIMKRF